VAKYFSWTGNSLIAVVKQSQCGQNSRSLHLPTFSIRCGHTLRSSQSSGRISDGSCPQGCGRCGSTALPASVVSIANFCCGSHLVANLLEDSRSFAVANYLSIYLRSPPDPSIYLRVVDLKVAYPYLARSNANADCLSRHGRT
jgi:hypothetical protein